MDTNEVGANIVDRNFTSWDEWVLFVSVREIRACYLTAWLRFNHQHRYMNLMANRINGGAKNKVF